jgi:Protein of unknown function (DUF3592)
MTHDMEPVRSEMPRLPRGCGWTLLALGGLSLLIGILSIIAIPIVWKRSQEVWTETTAQIVEAHVLRGERRSNQTHGTHGNKRSVAVTFTVMLRYDYIVAGTTYRGDTKALEQPDDDETYALVQPILDAYPAGRVIPVFYHPDDVTRSRLTAMEPRQEVVLDFISTSLFVLFGAFGLWAGRAILRRRKKRA